MLNAEHKKRDRVLGYAKLFLLLGGGIAAFWVLTTHVISIYWILIPVFLFVVLAVVHERVIEATQTCSRAIAFYERGLARIANQWPGKGETGDRFSDPSHPYSRDLDLFGKGSLFELLCDARTRAGEDTLASWLLAPAPPDEVRSRNAAVIELRTRLDLREDLAILEDRRRAGVQSEPLADWGEQAPLLASGAMRIVLPLLGALWLAAAIVWAAGHTPYLFLLIAVANPAVGKAFSSRMQRSVASIEKAAQDLGLLAAVLARLERESFSSPKLVALRAGLPRDGVPASRRIARLNRLVQSLESRRNLVVAVIDPFVFWTLQLSFAIEVWRKKFGPSIRQWLDSVGEMEALSSLAGYAYE
ncbi:MAG: hypothetical protein WCA98_17950, partial [Candidatus Acidiferrales bacterium]